MDRKNNINGVLNKMGEFLVAKLKLDQTGKGNSGLQQELVSLSAGKKKVVHEYYVKKISLFILILGVGIFLSLAGLISYLSQTDETEIQTIVRPGYGAGDRKEELEVQLEGEKDSRHLEFTVQERKYTDSERDELLENALNQLDQLVPGDNPSLDEVRTDLVFPDTLEDGAVRVSWLTIPYGVIDANGALLNPDVDEGTLIEIRAILSCGEKEAYYNIFAKIYPPIRDANEEVTHSIEKEVQLADAKDSYENTLRLPENINGKSLVWKKAAENPFWTLLIMTFVVAAVLYVEMDSQIHQKAENRKRQLMLDYPDLMWKMTMLLGAGLSIKGTFNRISTEYLREQKRNTLKKSSWFRKKTETVRYVYEEVSYTCYEMESGVPEAQAYERFGRRCQLPEYTRIGTVLSQNLKKGTKGLTALLEEEAAASMTERKNNARKIGEKAGTKLLLPMVLMLIVVLVILMVPAFLSF